MVDSTVSSGTLVPSILFLQEVWHMVFVLIVVMWLLHLHASPVNSRKGKDEEEGKVKGVLLFLAIR